MTINWWTINDIWSCSRGVVTFLIDLVLVTCRLQSSQPESLYMLPPQQCYCGVMGMGNVTNTVPSLTRFTIWKHPWKERGQLQVKRGLHERLSHFPGNLPMRMWNWITSKPKCKMFNILYIILLMAVHCSTARGMFQYIPKVRGQYKFTFYHYHRVFLIFMSYIWIGSQHNSM